MGYIKNELVDKMHYDVGEYLDLLLSSAQNILSPFGYTMDNLRALLHEQKQEFLQTEDATS